MESKEKNMSPKTTIRNKEEILHILDKSYRFTLVHPITRARKEFDRLKENQKVLIDFDFTPSSYFSLFFFLKLSCYSSFHPEIYVLYRAVYKVPTDERRDVFVFLKNLGIQKDHIRNAYRHARNPRNDLLDFAKEEKIHYIVSNDTNDDLINSYRYRFLVQGILQGTLPKERVEEENYSAILIRPFRYIKEKDILRFLDALNIHYVFSPKFRLEKETAQLLGRLEKTYSPFTKPNVLKSRRNVCPEKILGYEIDGKEVSFLDSYQKAGLEKDKKIQASKLEEKALSKAEKEHRPLTIDETYKNC